MAGENGLVSGEGAFPGQSFTSLPAPFTLPKAILSSSFQFRQTICSAVIVPKS